MGYNKILTIVFPEMRAFWKGEMSLGRKFETCRQNFWNIFVKHIAKINWPIIMDECGCVLLRVSYPKKSSALQQSHPLHDMPLSVLNMADMQSRAGDFLAPMANTAV